MRQFIQASLATLAIATVLSLVPAPASAGCGIHQGGECGRDAIFHRGEPRWGSPINTYVDRNQYPRRGKIGHRHGGWQSVPPLVVEEPYIYLKSRTCRDWKMVDGVKVTIRFRAC